MKKIIRLLSFFIIISQTTSAQISPIWGNGGTNLNTFYTYWVNGIDTIIKIRIDSVSLRKPLYAGKAQFNGAVQITDGTQSLNRVFTSDASGNGSWQVPASSTMKITYVGASGIQPWYMNATRDTAMVKRVLGAGGIVVSTLSDSTMQLTNTGTTYVPTLTNTTNISSAAYTRATYTQIGNVVHVTIGGTFVVTAINTASTLTVSLPLTTTNGTQTYIGTGAIAQNAGNGGYLSGIASVVSTTTATLNFYPTSSAGATANYAFSFDYTL